jgi:hypothetical protein
MKMKSTMEGESDIETVHAEIRVYSWKYFHNGKLFSLFLVSRNEKNFCKAGKWLIIFNQRAMSENGVG